MKFTQTFATLAAVVVPALGQVRQTTLTRSAQYDEPATPVNSVSCSRELAARGFVVFRDFPTFPAIGGADVIPANHGFCGSCWRLTFSNTTFTNSVFFTAINDAFSTGFISSESTERKLAGYGEGPFPSASTNITSERVADSLCGL